MKRLFLFAYALAFVFSCSTSDNEVEPNSESNFYALTIGNSWVYKYYDYNSNTDSYDENNIIELVEIIDTEEFFGNTYYKFKTTITGVENENVFSLQNGEKIDFYREVNGTLVNNNNTVLFVYNDFSEQLTFEVSSLNYFRKTIETPVIIDVEAGVFECIEMQQYIKTDEGQQLNGLQKTHYSDGIGLVNRTGVYSSLAIPLMIGELESYSIQN